MATFHESIVVVQVTSQYRAVHDIVLLIHYSTKKLNIMATLSEGVFSIYFELTLSTYESAQIKLLVDFLTLKKAHFMNRL